MTTIMRQNAQISPNEVLTHAARAKGSHAVRTIQAPYFAWVLVKPARLHFARTARALRDATYKRGALSEYPAARARASYWFDSLGTYYLRLFVASQEKRREESEERRET